MSERKVPKIRFPGFTGEWEEQELGTLVTRYEDHVETPHNGYERLGIRSHAKGTFHSYVAPGEELETAKMQRVASDKFIVNITFAWEHAVAVTDAEDAGKLVSHRFPQFSFRDGLDPSFFKYAMLDKRFKKHLELSSPGGAGRNRVLKIEDMLKYRIAVPSIEEQQKVSWLLDNVNDHIVYAETELNKWKELKKGMLQKMFPKEGESVPEIRFPGFTDPWEQRKLSDVVGVYDGVHQTPHYTESGVMFLSVENIATLTSQKFISEEAFERDYKVYPQKGDVLMTRIGDVGTPNVVETAEKLAFYVSLALLKPVDVDSYFLCNSIQSPRFKKGLKDRTLVTAIPQKINKDEIGKVDILMPESSAEQAKIGACFCYLDHLITLHQRECDKWQTLKKALLQQMFV